MPSRLPAPSHILDAIFAQTNKLSWEDRQSILRFLDGLESGPSRRGSQSQAGSAQRLIPADESQTAIVSTISQDDSGVRLGTDYYDHLQSQLLERQRQLRGNNSVRQILLHEERRIEMRPSSRNSESGNSVENGGRNDDGNASTETVGTTFLDPYVNLAKGAVISSSVENVNMKPFTIIDQIIFEMDYGTGCWRKLRRKIRMASDRRDPDNNPSSAASASSLQRRASGSNANEVRSLVGPIELPSSPFHRLTSRTASTTQRTSLGTSNNDSHNNLAPFHSRTMLRHAATRSSDRNNSELVAPTNTTSNNRTQTSRRSVTASRSSELPRTIPLAINLLNSRNGSHAPSREERQSEQWNSTNDSVPPSLIPGCGR